MSVMSQWIVTLNDEDSVRDLKEAGADELLVSVPFFSLRGAHIFPLEQLQTLSRKIHAAGAKLAVNCTRFFMEEELPRLREFLALLKDVQADTIYFADEGVLYEAAQLDFCGPVKYFFTMVLPMSKTVVATVSVFTFLNVWNDYLWPSLVFTSSDLLTAQIGLNSITSNENTTMGQTLAVITLVTIPVIIIYSLFSKQIVEGVTSTGSKEG